MKQTKSLIAVIGVLTMFSIAKAGGPIVDFDRASGESQHFSDYIAEQDILMRSYPAPIPTFSDTRDLLNSSAKLKELDNPGRKALIRLLKSATAAPSPAETLELANCKEVAILYNHQMVIFVKIARGNDYDIVLKSSDSGLVKAVSESSLQAKPAQNKIGAWVLRCRDTIDWVIRVVNGIEIATKVITKVCEHEWVEDGTPTTPGHIPFNPSHERNRK